MQTRSSLMLWGVVLLVLGLFMLVLPQIALGVLAFLLGILVIIRSLPYILAGPSTTAGRTPSWFFLLGLVGILIGILLLVAPFFVIVGLAILLGVGLIVIGIGDLLAAWRGTQTGSYRWLTLVIGLITLAVGIFMLVNPLLAASLVVQVAGIYAIVVGLLDIATGYMMPRGTVGTRRTERSMVRFG